MYACYILLNISNNVGRIEEYFPKLKATTIPIFGSMSTSRKHLFFYRTILTSCSHELRTAPRIYASLMVCFSWSEI